MDNMEKKVIDKVNEAESPNFNGCCESTNCEGALCEQGNSNTINTDLNNDSCINTISQNTEDHKKETITDSEEEKSGITEVNSINKGQSENSCSDTEKEVMSNPEEEKSGLTEVDNSSNDDMDKVESNLTPISKPGKSTEDFDTWQRIIRLDAIRANAEWVPYSPTQAAVSEETALKHATSVNLKDYTHLEPCRIYHASRLVAILEAYSLYDQEIGYCQGMSDLLSPLLAVIEDDNLAFWCFVGFMKKARHNFRLDEVGIRRQLNMVAKIIKFRDPHLYRHLEKLQAEDCFFVYRMVVVLFRRELDFKQILCLWEVMWADQTAIRAGIEKLTRGRMSLRAPPTDDLLLYAIAASVLQRRKLIIQSYSSMDEIIRECNNMAGRLDVWNLLENAHDLVAALHDKM